MMKRFFLFLLLTVFLLIPVNSYPSECKDRVKQVERDRKAKKKKAAKGYKKALKRHWKGQEKGTQKEMKKHYKNAEKKYGKRK